MPPPAPLCMFHIPTVASGHTFCLPPGPACSVLDAWVKGSVLSNGALFLEDTVNRRQSKWLALDTAVRGEAKVLAGPDADNWYHIQVGCLKVRWSVAGVAGGCWPAGLAQYVLSACHQRPAALRSRLPPCTAHRLTLLVILATCPLPLYRSTLLPSPTPVAPSWAPSFRPCGTAFASSTRAVRGAGVPRPVGWHAEERSFTSEARRAVKGLLQLDA